jgi:hypothetical protein
LAINSSSSSAAASASAASSLASSFEDQPETPIHWRHPLLAVLFLIFCMATVFGNCLVVLAVFTKRYLRNPTGKKVQMEFNLFFWFFRLFDCFIGGCRFDCW